MAVVLATDLELVDLRLKLGDALLQRQRRGLLQVCEFGLELNWQCRTSFSMATWRARRLSVFSFSSASAAIRSPSKVASSSAVHSTTVRAVDAPTGFPGGQRLGGLVQLGGERIHLVLQILHVRQQLHGGLVVDHLRVALRGLCGSL